MFYFPMHTCCQLAGAWEGGGRGKGGLKPAIRTLWKARGWWQLESGGRGGGGRKRRSNLAPSGGEKHWGSPGRLLRREQLQELDAALAGTQSRHREGRTVPLGKELVGQGLTRRKEGRSWRPVATAALAPGPGPASPTPFPPSTRPGRSCQGTRSRRNVEPPQILF